LDLAQGIAQGLSDFITFAFCPGSHHASLGADWPFSGNHLAGQAWRKDTISGSTGSGDVVLRQLPLQQRDFHVEVNRLLLQHLLPLAIKRLLNLFEHCAE
jgi:hypothetical protein